jgi:hypothetical protein
MREVLRLRKLLEGIDMRIKNRVIWNLLTYMPLTFTEKFEFKCSLNTTPEPSDIL